MLKGDLSNQMPRRVLVNIEPVLIKTEKKTKKFRILNSTTQEILYDTFLLNKFYLYSFREGVNLELVSFGISDDELERMFNEIDTIGANPFRYHKAYKSPAKLAQDLPYRPEVLGVIDIPENRLMYGHWALDF